jgi:hypothetical protein
MTSEEVFGKFDAGLIRERLLADYVDIWEYVFESDDFTGWAYDNEISRLYVHAAPQCGKTTFSAAVAEKLLSEHEGEGAQTRSTAHPNSGRILEYFQPSAAPRPNTAVAAHSCR